MQGPCSQPHSSLQWPADIIPDLSSGLAGPCKPGTSSPPTQTHPCWHAQAAILAALCNGLLETRLVRGEINAREAAGHVVAGARGAGGVCPMHPPDKRVQPSTAPANGQARATLLLLLLLCACSRACEAPHLRTQGGRAASRTHHPATTLTCSHLQPPQAQHGPCGRLRPCTGVLIWCQASQRQSARQSQSSWSASQLMPHLAQVYNVQCRVATSSLGPCPSLHSLSLCPRPSPHSLSPSAPY